MLVRFELERPVHADAGVRADEQVLVEIAPDQFADPDVGTLLGAFELTAVRVGGRGEAGAGRDRADREVGRERAGPLDRREVTLLVILHDRAVEETIESSTGLRFACGPAVGGNG
jgi:hypothetical protein